MHLGWSCHRDCRLRLLQPAPYSGERDVSPRKELRCIGD